MPIWRKPKLEKTGCLANIDTWNRPLVLSYSFSLNFSLSLSFSFSLSFSLTHTHTRTYSFIQNAHALFSNISQFGAWQEPFFKNHKRPLCQKIKQCRQQNWDAGILQKPHTNYLRGNVICWYFKNSWNARCIVETCLKLTLQTTKKCSLIGIGRYKRDTNF